MLKDVITNLLVKEYEAEDERDHTKWHLSGFGQCLRKRIYQRAGYTALPLCPKTIKTFAMGHMMHEWLQARLSESGEIEVIDTEIVIDQGNISGHADLLVKIDNKRILYEIKTIHFMAMNKYMKGDLENNLAEAYPWHHAQLSAYVYFLSKAGVKIDEARILYVCKSSMFMSEVPLRQHDTEQEIEILENAWSNYKLANELPKQIEGWQCDYCQYRDTCKNKKGCDCELCRGK